MRIRELIAIVGGGLWLLPSVANACAYFPPNNPPPPPPPSDCDGVDFPSPTNATHGAPTNFASGGHYTHCGQDLNVPPTGFLLTNVLNSEFAHGFGFDFVIASACVAVPSGARPSLTLTFDGPRLEVPLTYQNSGMVTGTLYDYYSGSIPTYLRVSSAGTALLTWNNSGVAQTNAHLSLDFFGISYLLH